MLKTLIQLLLIFFSFTAFPSQLLAEKYEKGSWDEYFQDTLNVTKPQYTLALALKYFAREEKESGLAVDLGTGTGRDALFLLEKGWNVLAIDAESMAIDILLNRVQENDRNRIEVNISPFSEMSLPDHINLINASFSLPFCSPEDFPDIWQNIVDHLEIGGRFAGQFFGIRDEGFSDINPLMFSQEQVMQLFQDRFEIEYLQIEAGLIPAADGSLRQWHTFHVVAKKIK